MKKCKRCGRCPPEVVFYSVGVIRGKRYYDGVCNLCRQEEQRVRTEENQKWLYQLKEDRGCERCGGHFPHYVLEFHHTSGDKTEAVYNLVSQAYGRRTILAEISKCTLLCANCHREVHHYLLTGTEDPIMRHRRITLPFSVGEEVYDDLTQKICRVIGIQYEEGRCDPDHPNISSCQCWGIWLDNDWLRGGRHPWEVTKLTDEIRQAVAARVSQSADGCQPTSVSDAEVASTDRLPVPGKGEGDGKSPCGN